MAGELFDRLDEDGDGRLGFEEFRGLQSLVHLPADPPSDAGHEESLGI